jgi:hypothetical protein
MRFNLNAADRPMEQRTVNVHFPPPTSRLCSFSETWKEVRAEFPPPQRSSFIRGFLVCIGNACAASGKARVMALGTTGPRNHVAVSIATTGINPLRDGSTEVGAVRFDYEAKLLDTFWERVNPGVPVPEHVTSLSLWLRSYTAHEERPSRAPAH